MWGKPEVLASVPKPDMLTGGWGWKAAIGS
jgi:hypothetical protein